MIADIIIFLCGSVFGLCVFTVLLFILINWGWR